MLRICTALLTVVLGSGVGVAGTGHDADEADRPEPKVQPSAKASKASTAAKAKKTKARKSRASRHKMVGRVVMDDKLRQTPLLPPSGKLHLKIVNSHDDIQVNIFNEDGSYNIDALKQVSHVLRCKRTDTEKDVEPRLVAILSHIYDHFGKPLEVVSGYRNQRNTGSYHYKGSAGDIRIAGVKPAQIRSYAESLDTGGMGIGIYPKSGFVHVDVRIPPSYRWVDYSRSTPDSPDKRPPRGFKRTRKPLS